jgi:hypothetical protein
LEELLGTGGKWSEEPWAENLRVSLKTAMSTVKLSKYYNKTTNAFVSSDAMILDPTVKLELFELWSKEGERNYTQEYSDRCREQFMGFYQRPSDVNTPGCTSSTRKRMMMTTMTTIMNQSRVAWPAKNPTRMNSINTWAGVCLNRSQKSTLCTGGRKTKS